MITIRKSIMAAIRKFVTGKFNNDTRDLLIDFYEYDNNELTLISIKCKTAIEACPYYDYLHKSKDNHWRKDDLNDCRYCVRDECYNDFKWLYFSLEYLIYLIKKNDPFINLKGGN